MPLEDELGDIIQKARDGKAWSQDDLVRATNLPQDDIQRIENYQLKPEDSVVLKLAKVLDLDGPTLMDISQDRWTPKEPSVDPNFDLVCLNVFMGGVSCKLLPVTLQSDRRNRSGGYGSQSKNDYQQGPRDGRSS